MAFVEGMTFVVLCLCMHVCCLLNLEAIENQLYSKKNSKTALNAYCNKYLNCHVFVCERNGFIRGTRIKAFTQPQPLTLTPSLLGAEGHLEGRGRRARWM